MNSIVKKILKFWESSHRWPVLIAIVVGILLGLLISGGSPDPSNHKHETSQISTEQKTGIWTCSMHPQIRQPKPGKCPICGMDLIPASSGNAVSNRGELKLSSNAVKLAGIQVKPVERRFVATEIRMVGKVEFDETRLGYITSRMPGRIDRLYVDYTGTPVRKGDHLVYLYSPDLITAQQELQQSLRTLHNNKNDVSSSLKKMSMRNVSAAREKLRLWGLTPSQIKNIERSKKPEDHLTIFSPMKGIVIHKNAVEGIYVKTGTRIYTIADLSQVWVKLDAYESDLTWLRYGQTVEFEVEAYPGEIFNGKISFIDPVLNPKTRTIKVRVNVLNTDHKLKPEMFVRGVVQSRLSVSGKVMDPDISGKWISPMHPEIIKDKPGTCDVCGMPLVKAEELGYITASEKEREAPLVIPASAPLITGTGAVVYVAIRGEAGTFEGRRITLGPRAGNYYLVKKGLHEGEKVVVNGAFKIDSDLQIQAKPSMMNPEGGGPPPGHNHGEISKSRTPADTSAKEKHQSHKTADHKSLQVPREFRKSVQNIMESYFSIQHALSSDDLELAKEATETLLKKLANVNMNLLKDKTHMEWMMMEQEIKTSGRKLSEAADIETARIQFEILNTGITNAIINFGSWETEIYQFHCPMAFNNKGAFWLQNNPETRNPYFGAMMLTCKDSMEKLIPSEKTKK